MTVQRSDQLYEPYRAPIPHDPEWRPTASRVKHYRENAKSFYPADPREEITERQKRMEHHAHQLEVELHSRDPLMHDAIVNRHRYWIGMHKAVIEQIVLETIVS